MPSLENLGLEPNKKYENVQVKKKNENVFYKLSRTSNKILFYIDKFGSERRLFLKNVEQIVGHEEDNDEQVEHLVEKEVDNNFLFQSEYNPFFGNDFIWASMEDFCNNENEMFT